MSRAFQADIMEQRTLRAVEVRTVIHLVASLYTMLPPWLLPSSTHLSKPSLSFAMLACREAVALVGAAATPTGDGKSVSNCKRLHPQDLMNIYISMYSI